MAWNFDLSGCLAFHRRLYDCNFLFGQAVEFVYQLIDLLVCRFDLAREDGALLVGPGQVPSDSPN